jgi:hypothetical protein
VNIVAIGLEDDVAAEIEKQSGHKIQSFPQPPRIYAKEGKAYVKHPHIMGYYFAPDFVLWYGYFDDPSDPMRNTVIRASRLALAISNTPTFPDVRTTLPWDDKMLSVVLALTVDEVSPPRGLFPPMNPVESSPNTVLKWGNGHCGDGKQLLVTGQEEYQACVGDVLAEPFVEGRSYRILIVDQYLCQLEYESADWRKNVKGSVKVCETVNFGMALRAQEIASHYCLSVAGIDFVQPGEDEPAMLLEVNAYPSLEQDVREGHRTSKTVFCRQAVEQIREAQDALRSSAVQ